MEMVGRAFRGFLNLTASGVLLLIGTLLFFGMMDMPANSPASNENGALGVLAVLALGLLCAYLTFGFYRQGEGKRTWVASSIISALATLEFFAVLAMWAIHHS